MLQRLAHNRSHFNGNSSAPTVSGYALALNDAPAPERAFVAARLVLGWVTLINPRVTQASRLARVSVPYTDAALKVLQSTSGRDLEAAVCNGDISLLEAAVLACHPQPNLAEKFMAASAAERADLAKTAGVATLWDELIIPHL